MHYDGYALITGATGGLGKAFVYQVAKRGQSLILTGRSQEKLTALQTNIEKEFQTLDVKTFPMDLTNEQDRYAFIDKIKQAGLRIGLLVNAAGADIQKPFSAYTQEKIAFQCRVNFEAAVSLCHVCIQQRASNLEIINVSSVSGIYPMPYFAIYSATKTALARFSVALREEMKGQGVAVTAVLPGAMPTREDIRQQIRGQGLWGKLAVKSPEWVAAYALRAVAKNKAKVIPGFFNKAMQMTTACIPIPLKLKFIAKRWSKISKDAF